MKIRPYLKNNKVYHNLFRIAGMSFVEIFLPSTFE